MDIFRDLAIYINRPEFLVGVAFGLVLCALVVALFTLLRRPPQMFEAFSNEQGKVLVSRQALQEQIQRRCEELGDVGKARATVIDKSGTLSIHIRLRVRSNARLIGISGYLQEQIDAVLRRNLGIENVGPIDIIVTGILPHAREEQVTSIKPEEKAAE
jgi:hypothetical protein